MKKTVKFIITSIAVICALVLLFFSSEWLFPSWNGSYNLGNNLYMMDWDNNTRIIVFCSNKKGRTCYGGTYVIPDVKKNKYPTYVDSAKSNEKWIIVKAIGYIDDKEYYYIVDKHFDAESLKKFNCSECDSILQSHIIGALNYQEFNKKTKELGIDLKFE
jgi:hypothetical protein